MTDAEKQELEWRGKTVAACPNCGSWLSEGHPLACGACDTTFKAPAYWQRVPTPKPVEGQD